MGRAGLPRCPDWPALQGSSLQVGSDLLKFEEPVNMLEPGTFSFRTPKVQLLGRAGQAAGPRLSAELKGPRGRRLPAPCSAEEAEVAGQAGVASEHVCFLLSSGVKVIISVSETLAFPCCPSAMRVHRGTVVTPWAWVGAGSAACPCVCPQLSHDGNETLPLHLYVKSFGKNIDSKLQGGEMGMGGGGGGQWGWVRGGPADCWLLSPSAVTLYNCSFGRSDCSLCLAADPAYKCVWCSGQSRCVYEALCNNVTSECPPPVITRVSPPRASPVGREGALAWTWPTRMAPACPSCQVTGLCQFQIQPETGPLGGGIRITILGSNLGVKADDVKRVTVAGQDCAFEPERYSVSTR